jgi:hypothetical protein
LANSRCAQQSPFRKKNRALEAQMTVFTIELGFYPCYCILFLAAAAAGLSKYLKTETNVEQ